MISSEKWVELNNLYTKDTLKQLISDAVGSGIELPYRNITSEAAEKDFRKLLSIDTNSLLKPSEWFTRYDYSHLQPLDIITTSNVGNKASDFFHQESRWLCGYLRNIRKFINYLLTHFSNQGSISLTKY